MSRRARPRRRPRVTLGLACGVAISALAGCGYALVGTGGGGGPLADRSIKSVAILPFENRTQRPEIEQRITEEVSSEFSKRSGRRVVPNADAADVVMDGAVLDFRTRPVQFSQSGRATRVEALVTIQATLRERATDAVLWSQNQLVFREQFDVVEDGAFFDQETIALDDIARGAASALVTSIVEGF